MSPRLASRLLFLAMIGASACKLNNPDFDPQVTDTGSEGAIGDGEAGTEGSLCELQPSGGELIIEVPQGCGENNADGYYDRLLQVTEKGTNEITGNNCGQSCDGETPCNGVPSTLTVSPLPIGNLVAIGDCVYFRASRRVSDENSCSYEAIAIWRNDEPEPVVVARSSDVELPGRDGAANGWVSYRPGTTPIESCDCELSPESCCDGDAPPTNYAFTLSGDTTSTPPDDTASVSLDGLKFSFYAIHAFNPGGCDQPDHLAWGLTYP